MEQLDAGRSGPVLERSEGCLSEGGAALVCEHAVCAVPVSSGIAIIAISDRDLCGDTRERCECALRLDDVDSRNVALEGERAPVLRPCEEGAVLGVSRGVVGEAKPGRAKPAREEKSKKKEGRGKR